MTIRSVADLKAQAPLSPAEELVLAQLDTGEDIELGVGDTKAQQPDAADESRKVRAALIRLLMLRDDEEYRLHEKGLRIWGAWIPDQLDLEGCTGLRDLGLFNCRLDQQPDFRSADFQNLFLNGSRLPGLSADGLEAKGSVFLRGIDATGEVALPGVRLGGDLDCDGARFRAEKDAEGNTSPALFADRLEAKGSVFLRDVDAIGTVRLHGAKLGGALDCDGARFRAENDATGDPVCALFADGLEAEGDVFLRDIDTTGTVRLPGAKLGGDLDCCGARFREKKDAHGNPGHVLSARGLEARGSVFLSDGFEADGTVWLPGAKLRGDLSCTGGSFRAEKDALGNPGHALNLGGVSVEGTLYLREGACVEGLLDLTGAEFSGIADDAACWPGKGDLVLNRCRYGAILAGPVDAASRLDWLARQSPAGSAQDFWPQPYEQLAKVLREMGHGADARKVLIEKERLQRAARRARVAGGWKNAGLAFWDTVLAWTVRYGHQPLWAFAWLLGAFLMGWSVFQSAADSGSLKPNSAIVLRSEEWVACQGVPGPERIACFQSDPRAAGYPRFSSAIYSLDALLPIVSLEMQEYWIPDETAGGRGARAYLWVHIAVGWALSLLAVAGFRGW